MSVEGTVYLLHFSDPVAHARHYLGWTANLSSRVETHAYGEGSPLVRALMERGGTFECVRTWNGDRHFERHLKRQKSAPKLCPLCSGDEMPAPADADAMRPYIFGQEGW